MMNRVDLQIDILFIWTLVYEAKLTSKCDTQWQLISIFSSRNHYCRTILNFYIEVCFHEASLDNKMEKT